MSSLNSDYLEQAKKRRMERQQEAQSRQESDPNLTHQQGSNAVAGTQSNNTPSSVAASLSKSSASTSQAPAASSNVMGVEPTYLLDIDQFKQVVGMNLDSLKALAKAMTIEEDEKSKAVLLLEIARFTGTCDSVKSFDVSTDEYEFENLKKQDFQQPAASQSSA